MSIVHAAARARRLRGPSTSTLVVVGCSGGAWLVLIATSPPVFGNHVHAGPVVDPWQPAWAMTWLLMVMAMMWPLSIPALTAVGRSSYAGWRIRLQLAVLATITALWMGVGLVAASLMRELGVPVGAWWWNLLCVSTGLTVARSAHRARVQTACLRLPPLAPGGRRGVASSVRAGVRSWRGCVLLCAPVMAVMLAGHDLMLMSLASAAVWWEAWHPRAWRDPMPTLLLAACAAWVVATQLLPGGAGHG